MKTPEELTSILQDLESQLNQVRATVQELKEVIKPVIQARRTKVHTIELDVAEPEDVEQSPEFIRQMCRGRPAIYGRLVSNQGPGGGWPVYRFTGPYYQLLEAIQECYDSGVNSLADYVVEGAED